MSVEFVEPSAGAEESVLARTPRASVVSGRLLGTAAAVAGALTIAGVQLTLYSVVRTASIVDFDSTEERVARIPVDAFGHSARVALGSTRGLALSDFTVEVSTPDGLSYGPWWIGLGIALLVVAGWCLARPRSSAPVPFVAALGGLLLGSLGAAWLAARAVAGTSVPQIRFVASPGTGLWILVAAGAIALLAALACAIPRLRRRAVVEGGPSTDSRA